MKQSVVRIFLVLLAVPMAAIAETSPGSIQSSIDTKTIEYFWSQPEGKGPFPLLLLVHPDQDSPKSGGRSFVDSGQLDYWSKKGFLTVAISQPGYGGSGGPADFCGPRTQQATLDLLKFFRSKTELVSTHTFIYGGSRGAAVASMVAGKDLSLSGVILKSGVYDFVEWSKLRSWFDPIKLTMFWEIGWLSDVKLRERSAIYFADQIKSPVLIIHGTQDNRAPMALAEKFSEAINHSGGHAELVKIESEHVIPMTKVDDLMGSFMGKY